ncbi:hypothetical protein A0U94_06635 [Gluconobacter albidus]|uniref:hypothetical protein n=1 Tax=Gluconobacter albidus TaxID=318683 RepID=UPI00098A23ED|nr:hypothetical protein [Gluconobacter albidus]AQS90698.1 hypothetical protein A0U94_06635 [Gluconobacter albidus]
MDLNAAISEPFARLLTFHNSFNRSIKVSFGALSLLADQRKSGDNSTAVSLPTAGEPWGTTTLWRNLDAPVKNAAILLVELGIARAADAFEDYATGAKAEFDRAGINPAGLKENGTSALHGFDAVVGLDTNGMTDLLKLANFFDTARNCIVHRSNRANASLAALRADPAIEEILHRWPKRSGKWSVSLPPVVAGHIVEWRPRHAILASDVYYRAAVALDRVLVEKMGPAALVRMAAHWCFFADPLAPCPSKHSPDVMVRAQLQDRYKIKNVTIAETITLLREIGRWEAVRAAWKKRYPQGPETSLSLRRRLRNDGTKAGPGSKGRTRRS